MITLDTGDLGKVDVKSLQQQMAEREEIIVSLISFFLKIIRHLRPICW